MNKYNFWYNAIVENARTRTITGYKETHHILPRSLGGTDDNNNLVDLTAREHFICHWLLVKIHTGEARHKMVYALNGMKRNGKDNERYETPITSRVYQKLKEEFGRIHSETMKGRTPWNKGKPATEEIANHLRNIAKTRPLPTPEQIAKRVAKQIGQKRSKETKLKMSLAAKGKPKGPMSEEMKLKISQSLLGTKKTKTHADNVRNAVAGNISINKDGVEKKVKKDTLQEWLDNGWSLGGRKRVQDK